MQLSIFCHCTHVVSSTVISQLSGLTIHTHAHTNTHSTERKEWMICSPRLWGHIISRQVTDVSSHHYAHMKELHMSKNYKLCIYSSDVKKDCAVYKGKSYIHSKETMETSFQCVHCVSAVGTSVVSCYIWCLIALHCLYLLQHRFNPLKLFPQWKHLCLNPVTHNLNLESLENAFFFLPFPYHLHFTHNKTYTHTNKHTFNRKSI